jgi:radical SAM enzyme (rSAM/lipoprotein system)
MVAIHHTLSHWLHTVYCNFETKNHPLNYLFWECTTRCNLNCLHCGSDCRAESVHRDMPFHDFEKALDTLPQNNANLIVVITGGEPLLRNDLEACGLAIRKKGFRWGIVTNGMAYTPERHNTLLNAGMGALTISLDGLEKNHNWLRSNNKSFSKALSAIELAANSSRLNFDVVTCVNPKNIDELEAIAKLLETKGVKTWRLFTIAPLGRAKNNKDLILSSDDLKRLLQFIVNYRKKKSIEVKFSCEGFVGPYEKRVRDHYFFCRAGINIGSVLIDGSISACPNIDRKFSQGNIYTDHFYTVWKDQFKIFRDRKWLKTGICSQCKQFSKCLGNGFHLRNPNSADPIICYNQHITTK